MSIFAPTTSADFFKQEKRDGHDSHSNPQTFTGHIFIPDTQSKAIVPTTKLNSIAPTTEFNSIAPTTEFNTIAPTTEFNSIAPTTEFNTIAPTTEFNSIAPTTEFNSIAPTTESDSISNQSSNYECKCGHLHGPGQGNIHDICAVGFAEFPLLRGPD